jgi:hypothetical protein
LALRRRLLRSWFRGWGWGCDRTVVAVAQGDRCVASAPNFSLGLQVRLSTLRVGGCDLPNRFADHFVMAGSTDRSSSKVSAARQAVELIGGFLVALGFGNVAHVIQ